MSRYTSDMVSEFMDTNKLNVEEMADLMGVTQQAVKYWITGERGVPETTVRVFLMFERQPELMDDF